MVGLMGRQYLHSLEGIRAYAFLLVFAVHYSDSLHPLPHDGGLLRWLWFLLSQVSWAAVPVFFVLSGFLITGVLFDTRGVQNFFRTFYARRALRVLPLYYLVLACSAAFAWFIALPFSWKHLFYLVYLHNFVRTWSTMYSLGRYVDLGHLWSLAIEEQFYLIWPVVIFLLQSRRRLLGCCYSVMVLVGLLRIFWPMTHLSYLFAYECSLTRCDALMAGAALALHRRGPSQSLTRWVLRAMVVGLGGILFLLGGAVWVGQALPFDRFGTAVLVPIVNLIAAAAVVLAIEPSTVLSRLCSKRRAVSLGGMSYSLYIVHEPFAGWFRAVLRPLLLRHGLGGTLSLLITLALGFLATYLVARVTYRFIEMPALRLKDRFRYGPARGRGGALPAEVDREPEAVSMKAVA
ncbi:MAG: hypothetical protein NVSMB3_04070 [Acidobacteriaceae bacterium]